MTVSPCSRAPSASLVSYVITVSMTCSSASRSAVTRWMASSVATLVGCTVSGQIRRQATNAGLDPPARAGADTCAAYLTNKHAYLDYPTASVFVERRRHATIADDPLDQPAVTRDHKDDYLVALARLERLESLRCRGWCNARSPSRPRSCQRLGIGAMPS